VNNIPVISIDGPAAAGKGTVARQTAAALNFHYLDSGKIYRAVAWALLQRGEDAASEAALLETASQLSANAAVRRRLLDVQQGMRRPPGLVADGRDMGSVVFPDAVVKIFLTASAETRAKRRFAELSERGINATIKGVGADIKKRDWHDETRANSSLKPPFGSIYIDSTRMSPDDVVRQILGRFYAASGGG